MYGPQIPFSEELHASKYRGVGENFREAMNRVANALKDDEDHYKVSREILLDMRFLPGGRIQSAIGSTKAVTAYNCFVSGTIEDSLIHGNGNIHQRAGEALTTMRMGGGIGYDWSTLRPRGALIKKLESRSGGPIPWMRYYDAGGQAIKSSGHRRGAQMGVLRVDHPDIEEFIHAKQNATELTGFNISVAVTDEFMDALAGDKPFKLTWNGEEYREVSATELWDTVMRSSWDWAEPGVLFIDQINRMNNLYYCEKIAATNPCGEQPLPPFGACLLGSFNLVKYLLPKTSLIESAHRFDFDWERFKADIPVIVRMMDNVVDRTIYPLYEQEKEAKAKRRMGLGVAGLANCIETVGHAYGTPAFLVMEEAILGTLSIECYKASAMLAKEKGSFPLYHGQSYLHGKFIQTLPQDVRDLIARYGMRNSHLTSIAPTGTISTCADNISGGIEPVFSLEVMRTVQEFDGERREPFQDYAYRVFGTKGKVSADVTCAEHLDVLVMAQKHVDSAVSKTCNVPGDTSWEAFKQIYVDAGARGAKGCTTYRTDGKRGAVLVAQPAPVEEGAACKIDAVTGHKDCG